MPKIELLQASVDSDDESELRILVDDKHVKYLTIDHGLYDSDDMCFEPAITTMLPPLPLGDWNQCRITPDPATGHPTITQAIKADLPTVHPTWHPRKINHLDLHHTRKLRTNVYEATTSSLASPVIVKFARFPFEIAWLDAETRAYEWIQGHDIGPAFLGHVLEEERVIGFVMERVEGAEHAGPGDVERCRRALGRLHALGIRHGDVNRHNFLVRGKEVTLIDFDCAEVCRDEGVLAQELESLEREFSDTSGRGGVLVHQGD